MATLSNEKRRKAKKRKYKFSLFIIIISLLVTPYIAAYIDQLFENNFKYDYINISYINSFATLMTNHKQLLLFLICESFIILTLAYLMTSNIGKITQTKTNIIAGNIEIPVAVGQGQHGTSRFLTEKEKDETFYTVVHDKRKKLEVNKNLGIVLGMTTEKHKEIIHCLEKDVNTILIGSTRSGKTRRAILETIWLRAASGKSMVITDVKGELFIYTKKYLNDRGYNVIDFDLRQPQKSKRYNYLSKITKAVEDNDIPRAIDYTWDFVSVLVGVPKGEPLWTNGESAVIAAAILTVVIDAPKEYKNLTNVYYFLAKMCKTDIYGEMLITQYLKKLPESHPAKTVFDIAEISPEKMRGSFFGMALTTLRLFTNWNIADITSESEFDIDDIGKKKTALFIIIPDEKTTLYPLVSLFVNQIYVSLVEMANVSGGRLPVEVDFICDEFGNFPEIPSFGAMLSAGLGRGIRFTIVIQDYQQLEKKYKEDFGNIKGNCLLVVYLKSTDLKTQEEISKKTGTYTIEVTSVSNTSTYKTFASSNYSSSANMQSRALLLPEEVGRISSPYSLVLYGGSYPAIFYSPDLSAYKANEDFGLGDEEYNKKVFMERDNARKIHTIETINLWGIWKKYDTSTNQYDETIICEEKQKPKERVSFLR